jgi:hypothetical protein
MVDNTSISKAMTIKLEDIFEELPPLPQFTAGIRRAPSRQFKLSLEDTQLALKNALRYIPERWHQQLAPSPADGYTVTDSGLKDILKASRSTNTAAAVSRARRFKS